MYSSYFYTKYFLISESYGIFIPEILKLKMKDIAKVSLFLSFAYFLCMQRVSDRRAKLEASDCKKDDDLFRSKNIFNLNNLWIVVCGIFLVNFI